MRQLLVIAVALAFIATGCGTKKHKSSADGIDEIAQADTATLDSETDPEALPPVIDDATTAEAPADAPADAPVDTSVPAVAEEAPPVAGTGELASYTVQAGDTLMKIAFNVYGDIRQWKTIYELNKDKIKSANNLTAGTVVKYDKPASEPVIQQNGDPYMIKQGDTLGTIADDIYAKKSKWKQLYENNRTLIHDPNRIYAGFYLYYQITEEEKKQAEEIKARRGVAPQMGQVGKKVEDAAKRGIASVKPSAPAPAAAAPKGGLDALAAPSGN